MLLRTGGSRDVVPVGPRVTVALPHPRPSAFRGGPSPRTILTIFSLLIGWALCNPYFEIDHSNLIYSGRVLAELDPVGVGRDAMYRFDGQSGFTVFTVLNRFAAERFGLPSATMAISVLSVLVAFLGASTFVSAISEGRTRVLAIVYAGALPACYGGYKLFSYAETAATPRPFAEALVLCGLAMLVRGRLAWAAAAMAAAALLHPILALPGVLLLMAWLVAADRRWWIVLLVALVVVLTACVMHLPLFERLTTTVDPEWRAVLEGRNPHLFPSLWPPGWRGRAAARIATLLMAASICRGPVRKVFLLTVGVGIAGFGASYVNDRLGIELLVQAQTWRTSWLLFAIAPMAGAICTMGLWPIGGTRRIALALLALSWIFADYDGVALMLACTSLAFHLCIDQEHYPISKYSTVAVLFVASLLAMAGLVANEFEILRMTALVPTSDASEARGILGIDWDYTPFAVVAAIIAGMKRKIPTQAMLFLSVCGLSLLIVTWDRRSEQTRAFDAGIGMPELARAIDERPGEVFWLGGIQETWRWLGRPNWLSPIQGAGIVFSRPLAMFYKDRAERAWQSGLDGGSLLNSYDPSHTSRPILSERGLKAFCAAKDAPAWIVAPLVGSQYFPSSMAPSTWNLPEPNFDLERATNGQMLWRKWTAVQTVACASGPRA